MISMLLSVLDQSICIRLTQTLLHFLWEGTAIGLGTLALAYFCRTAGARLRYAIHAVGLALMSLSVPITFALTGPPILPPVEHVAISVVERASSSAIAP